MYPRHRRRNEFREWLPAFCLLVFVGAALWWLMAFAIGCTFHLHYHAAEMKAAAYIEPGESHELAERKQNVLGGDRGRNPWDFMEHGDSD